MRPIGHSCDCETSAVEARGIAVLCGSREVSRFKLGMPRSLLLEGFCQSIADKESSRGLMRICVFPRLKDELRQFWQQSFKATAAKFLDDWCHRAEATGIRVLRTRSRSCKDVPGRSN